MSTDKCGAIVLRKLRYSNTSMIFWLLTREFGRIDCLAKGCRRLSSPLLGHLDLFAHEEVMVIQRSQSGLALLTDASLCDEFVKIRKSPFAFAAASLLTEIVIKACMDKDPHPEAFDLLLKIFTCLEKPHHQPATLGAGVLALLTDLGFSPRLDHCVACENSISGSGVLSGARGGIICSNCFAGEKLSVGELKALRFLAEHTLHGLPALADTLALAVLPSIVDYTEAVIERGLKSKSILYGLVSSVENPKK